MTIIGIDLGSSAVKLALFEGRLGRYTLQGYRQATVPRAETGAPDLEARLQVLEELLGTLPDGKNSTFGLCFPGEHVSLRCIELPFRDRAQVARTLPFEVESLVPFDLEEMVLDSRHIEARGSGSRVFTAVAPRERVGLLLEKLANLGVELKALPIDVDLLGFYAEEGVQAVVDFGHERTLAALTMDGKVVSGRALSSGGSVLTQALTTEERTWADAEMLKHSLSLGLPPQPAAVEWDEEDAPPVAIPVTDPPSESPEVLALRAALSPWVAELRGTLILFEDENNVEITEVLLTGGSAYLQGLPDWLAQALGVQVRRIDIPGSEEESYPGRLALCHAVAERGHPASLPGNLFNLRQGEYEFAGNFARAGSIASLAAVAALVFFIGSLAMHFTQMSQLSDNLEGFDSQISSSVLAAFPDVSEEKAKDPTIAQAIVAERVAAMTQRAQQMRGLVSENPPMLTLLKEVSDGVPSHDKARVDVTEMHVVQGSLTMKMETDSFEHVEEIEKNLKAIPRFSQTAKSKEQRVSDGIRFTLTIPLTDETMGTEG